MDVGSVNERSARQLIHQCVMQGVEIFCIAPGSRCTPLVLAAEANPRAQTIVHYDERGLAFFALGLAKSSGKPVAIISTSGTAVANLMPAVMEASLDRVPLLLLTADRPAELRDCGANQTCDQVKLFQTYVRWQVDLPCSDEQIPTRYFATTVAQAARSATHLNPGPVHLNCMFREPLFPKDSAPFVEATPVQWEKCTPTLDSDTLDIWAERLQETSHGLILVGSLPPGTDTTPILQLAEKLDWPIFPDILSQVRTLGKHTHVIAHFDELLKAGHQQEVSAILHFGNRLVSKTLAEWLRTKTPTFYFQITDHEQRQDPDHMVTHRLNISPAHFAGLIAKRIPQSSSDAILFWQAGEALVDEHLEQLFAGQHLLTEPGLVHALATHHKRPCAYFFASSMPIRDTNLFFALETTCGPLFGNRGVSGIDGNIATIAGIAHGVQMPLIAIVGDQTLLHDLNSLPLLLQTPSPVLLIVVNNAGGGIFNFMPIASIAPEVCETHFCNEHSLTFRSAAELFALPYAQPQNCNKLNELLDNFFLQRKSQVIEVQTERHANVLFHQQISAELKQCLTSLTASKETTVSPK